MLAPQRLYRGLVVPALVFVAALSAASALLLQLGPPPRTSAVAPGVVLAVETVLLVVCGVLVPLVLLLPQRWRRAPDMIVACVSVMALLVHATTLGGPTRTGAQAVTSSTALLTAAAFFFVTVLATMERHDANSSRRTLPG